MAWGTPPSWAAGNTVTAAKLTTVSDDLLFLYTGAYEAWTAFTPTVKFGGTTATLSNNDSRYTKHGRLVIGLASFRVSSLNAGSGSLTVTFPVTARTPSGLLGTYMAIGTSQWVDVSAGAFYSGFTRMNSTTDMWVGTVASPGTAWSNTSPVTIATGGSGTGDEIQLQFAYEANA